MLTGDKVTEIFFMADEFCKFFDRMTEKNTIEAPSKRKYHRDGTLSKAEVMLIMMFFRLQAPSYLQRDGRIAELHGYIRGVYTCRYR